MEGRIWLGGIVLGIVSASFSQPKKQAQSPSLTTAFIDWADEQRSPAVCLGRDHWFVSVVPRDIESEKNDTVSLRVGERSFDSKILFRHPNLRLCLIQAPEDLPDFQCHPLADAISPNPGTELSCRTHLSNCRTTVAGKDYHYLGKILPVPLLRVNIAESNHFCLPGTPLINEEGKLEGILTDRIRGTENQAHAIPVAQVHKLIHEFERFQKSGQVWVGMVFHNMSTTPEVIEVREKSPAQRAGVAKGDVILRLDNQEVENLAELAELIRSLPAGKDTQITVLRGHERLQLNFAPEFAKKP